MKRLFYVVLCTILAASCSPPNIASTSGAAACADLAFARCSRISACSATAMAYRYPNVDTCKSLFQANCLENVAANGVTPAFEEGCAQAISSPSWSCDDFLLDQNIPPACMAPAGSQPTGSACVTASQCSGGFCAIESGAACGTCASPPAVGSSCATIAGCAVGQTCEVDNMQCTAYATLSQPCSTTQPCAAGLGCASSSSTCEPQAEMLGAACLVGGAGCDFYQGISCNSTTMICASVQFVGPGQACGFIGTQDVYCVAGAQCLGGTCVAAAPVGQACDLVNGPICISPSHCIVSADAGADGGTSGTCQIYDPTLCH
jgi:hypothetical protein